MASILTPNLDQLKPSSSLEFPKMSRTFSKKSSRFTLRNSTDKPIKNSQHTFFFAMVVGSGSSCDTHTSRVHGLYVSRHVTSQVSSHTSQDEPEHNQTSTFRLELALRRHQGVIYLLPGFTLHTSHGEPGYSYTSLFQLELAFTGT